jgi:hypothetical protein
LLVDSTSLKIYGEGEWLDQKHGIRSRRRWRKLNLGIAIADVLKIDIAIPDHTVCGRPRGFKSLEEILTGGSIAVMCPA